MINVEKSKLQEGMVLAEEIIGKNNMRLNSGTMLSERFITIIKNNFLFPLLQLPITDESYSIIMAKTSGGDAIDQLDSTLLMNKLQIANIDTNNYIINSNLVNCNENLHIPKGFIVSGDIINCKLIYVDGDLSVMGTVRNSNIICKGNLQIRRDIDNNSKQYRINCSKVVDVNHVKYSVINANIINVRYSISNSEIIASDKIDAPSAMNINNSILQAGLKILLGSIQQETTLIIISNKQIKMYKDIIDIENKLRNFQREIDPLKQSIKVFQILRDRIAELPEKKRNELVENAQKYKVELEKQQYLKSQVEALKMEAAKIRASRENNPIIIENIVEKGTKVIIDDKSLIVQMRDKGVVFYKKGMIIMGKKDKTWGSIA